MFRLLEGADEAVASWVWKAYDLRPVRLDKAIGIVDREGNLTGAILLSNYNGNNIEMGYYGRWTFTPAIVRYLAQLALRMNVTRSTILTSKRNKLIIKFLSKVGARLEGVSRRFYGSDDCPRNTAVRFVLFKEDFTRIAYGNPMMPQPEMKPHAATAIQ